MTAGAGPDRPAFNDPAFNDPVSGEAARLARRLEVALGRLRSSLPTAVDADDDYSSRSKKRIEGADDEVRHLLAPTVERVTQLTELTHALADGTQSEESTRCAAEAVAATQPFRRPR